MINLREQIRRKQTGTQVIWRPVSFTQYQALVSNTPVALFQGNRGGGKTDLLVIDFLRSVGKGYGSRWRGCIIRQTYPQLTEIKHKTDLLIRPTFPKARWNGSRFAWEFPDGEVLYLRYLKKMADYWNFHGQEFQWLGIDELTSWPDPELITQVESTVRSSVKGIQCRTRFATNPAGPGHTWVKQRFIDKAPPGKIFKSEGLPTVHYFIDMYENKFLTEGSPEYIHRLEAIKDPELRKAWVDGSWNVIVGDMFADVYSPEFHVLEPFQIPPTWKIFRAFDWGSTRPFSVGWWAKVPKDFMLPDGRILKENSLIRIAEWYGWNGLPNRGVRMTSQTIAKGILKREKKMGYRVYPGPADSAIFDVRDGDSIAAKMESVGVRFIKCSKGAGSRKTGWDIMRAMLEAATKHPPENPGLYVFSTCAQWIRTVPSLPRDPSDLDDVDTDSEDHIADETRYMVSGIENYSAIRELNW